MSENIGAIQDAFANAEEVEPIADSPKIASGSPTRQKRGIAASCDSWPILPLGMASGKFYFLSARDELIELSAGAMTQRSNLVALVAGCDDGLSWLADIAPPKPRDVIFNASFAADELMKACADLPLFDPNLPIRHWGTWRGSGGNIVVHLGEDIECPARQERRGRLIDRALYPAVPGGVPPADYPASIDDITWIMERIARFWNWQGSVSASAIVIGWVGQAVLGQYPMWRTHLWIKGKNGAGKSTLLEIISALLGGMSAGVKNSSSAAAVRQTTNRQSICRAFDEAESDGSGAQEQVIALFRLMSDAKGAQVEKGTSDHSGVRFDLFGAGLFGSIIPGNMTPQDRSRFIMLDLAEVTPSASPEDAAALLSELEIDAGKIGPAIWRRMIGLAPERWDVSFRFYKSLLAGMGARNRAADTIGAILTGWDLMLYDDPVTKGQDVVGRERVVLARGIAEPLIESAKVAEAESEGERCLRAILATMLHKDHGGIITASELIDRMQEGQNEPDAYDQRLIGRIGLRVMSGPPGQKALFIANGGNPTLDKALGVSRWRGGNHRAALDTLEDVSPSTKPIRVMGSGAFRGVLVPAKYLPGHVEMPSA